MKITIDYDPSAEHGLERVEWERADDGKWQPFWTTRGYRHEHGTEEPQQVLWEIALTLSSIDEARREALHGAQTDGGHHKQHSLMRICRLLGEGDALLADLDPGIPA